MGECDPYFVFGSSMGLLIVTPSVGPATWQERSGDFKTADKCHRCGSNRRSVLLVGSAATTQVTEPFIFVVGLDF